ncbi:MAG: hypothetical protein ACT4PL_08950, partial [Phycisphaerales bacterium]
GLGLGLASWVPGWYQIPADRAAVAEACVPYLAGMIAAQILSAPFRVMFTAHQTMGVLTIADLADSIGKLLAIVLAARYAGPDRGALELLSMLTCLAQCVSSGIVVALCLALYPDGRPSPRRFSLAALRELTHFTTWSVVGNISYRLRMSGPPLLLARAFTTGSPVNTAYGLGVTVAGYQLNLSGAINRAAAPAVISAWGRGDKARVAELVQLVNKYSTLLALFYLVPLEIEMPTVLRLWLPPEKIPEFAVPFVRLVMIQMALSWLYMGYHHAISAHGRIARYMVIAVSMEVLSLIAAWGTLRLPGVPPWAMSITLSGMTLITCSIYVLHISRLLGLPFRDWITRTWLPVGCVLTVATGVAFIPSLVLPEGLVRVIVTTIAYAAAAFPCIWFVAMGREERGHFQRLARAGLDRLRSRGNG